MANLMNQSALRKLILERCRARRPQLGITRVSSEAMEDIESRVRLIVDEQIDSHPSIGKTFKP